MIFGPQSALGAGAPAATEMAAEAAEQEDDQDDDKDGSKNRDISFSAAELGTKPQRGAGSWRNEPLTS